MATKTTWTKDEWGRYSAIIGGLFYRIEPGIRTWTPMWSFNETIWKYVSGSFLTLDDAKQACEEHVP